jgi:DNA invertase Pin-like site-specific DNA recombinase
LVVTKLDRLARSLPDARAIAEELTVRQVRLSLGGSVYDPHDPVGRLLFNVLAMVAEFESDLIGLRTKEGMRVAKANGRLRGKKPKLNPRQEAQLVSLVAAGEHSTTELADLSGVGRSTVYRALGRSKHTYDSLSRDTANRSKSRSRRTSTETLARKPPSATNPSGGDGSPSAPSHPAGIQRPSVETCL